MYNLDDNLPLFFLGDNHGNWDSLLFQIKSCDIKNCYIVSVGDLGIGFKPNSQAEYNLIKKLNSEFSKLGIIFLGIRGNHDNPIFFKNDKKTNLINFKLIEDYSVYHYNSKLIQFIGGAVSIDRTGRKEGVSYWEDEAVKYEPEKCKKCDILVTHTAPSWCFPQQFNEMVYGWAREDAYLIEDLNDERAIMGKIFKLCSPKLHLYGHFHSSCTEKVDGCIFKLLDIDELWEFRHDAI